MEEAIKSSDVFTPGRFPVYTFVDEHLEDKARALEDTLDAGSMLVSISGPSKSGKTVFVEKCLGKDNVVQVTGSGISLPDDLWNRVFSIIGTPIPGSVTEKDEKTRGWNATGEVAGNALIAKAAAKAGIARASTSGGSETSHSAFDSLQLAIKELSGSGLVVFIDDFHYIPKDVQAVLAQHFKEAIRSGVKIITASVPYHSGDVLRGNPDLQGRIYGINFDYWQGSVLHKIAELGFKRLNINAHPDVIRSMAKEAAGSPQLMQYLCLNACYELRIRETSSECISLSHDDVVFRAICSRTVPSADYGEVVEAMKEGPKTRGSPRKIYITRFGWQGDVYRILVKALSSNPPALTFRYQGLTERIGDICTQDSPSGSSVISACDQSAAIVNSTNGERIVEWDGDNDVFDIRDPYFLFYLRWSGCADG